MCTYVLFCHDMGGETEPGPGSVFVRVGIKDLGTRRKIRTLDIVLLIFFFFFHPDYVSSIKRTIDGSPFFNE